MQIKNKRIIVCLMLFFIFVIACLSLNIINYRNNKIDKVNAASVSISGVTGSGTSSNPLLVKDDSDWSAIVNKFNGGTSSSGIYIEIKADLNLVNQEPLENFSGQIDGNFYTITVGGNGFIRTNSGYIQNCLFDGNNVYYNAANTNLTRKLKAEYSKNLPTIYSCWGAVASVNYGTIKFCGVQNIDVATSRSKLCFIGGISGFNEGTIHNCYTYNSSMVASFLDDNIHIDYNEYYGYSSSDSNYMDADEYKESACGGHGFEKAPVDLLSINAVGGIAGYLYNGTIKRCITANNILVSSGFKYVDSSYWLTSYKLNDSIILSRALVGGIFGFCAVTPSHTNGDDGLYATKLVYAHNGSTDYTMDTILDISGSSVYSSPKVSYCYTSYKQESVVYQKDYQNLSRGIYKNNIIGNLYNDINITYLESLVSSVSYQYESILEKCYALYYSSYTNNINTDSSNFSISTSKTITLSNSSKYAMYGAFSVSSVTSTDYYNNLQFKTDSGSSGKISLLGLNSSTWNGTIQVGSYEYPCFVQELSYSIHFYYNAISTLNSGTPSVNLTKSDGTDVSDVTYGDSLDFKLSEPTFTYSLLSGSESDYYVLWYVFKGLSTSFSTYVINTSLGTSGKYDDFTSENFMNVNCSTLDNEITWQLQTGYTEYTVWFQLYPKIPIKLNANGGTGTTQTVYALPNHDFIFNSSNQISENISYSFARTNYTLTGFSSSSTSTSLVLDNSLGIVGDGTYFNTTGKYLQSTNGSKISQSGMTLYAVWVQKVIEINVTHKVQGTSTTLGTTSITLDYINGGNKEFVGTFSGYEYAEDYEQTSKSISTAPDLDVSGTYIYVDSGLYEDFTGKITYALTAYYKKVEEDSGTEEPDTTEDICTITIKFTCNGSSIYSDKVYKFDYENATSTSVGNGDLKYLEQVTYSDLYTLTNYTHQSTSYSDNASYFLWKRETDYFKTENYFSDLPDDHNVYITLVFTSNSTEEPDTTEENVCIITIVYSGANKSNDVYNFYYLDADNTTGSIAYSKVIWISAPDGYTILDDPTVSGDTSMQTTFLQYAYDWGIKTVSSAPNVTGKYELTLTFECVQAININLTFNYNYTYEYGGQTYEYSLGSKEYSWNVTESGESYSIPIPATGYAVTSATLSTSTLYRVRKHFQITNLNVVAKSTVTSLTVGSTHDLIIDCTGTLQVLLNQTNNKTTSVKFTGVYYQGYKNENISLASLNNSTSGRYDGTLGLYELTFTKSITITGISDFIKTPRGNVEISGSYEITGYNIPTSVKTTLTGMSTTTQDGVQIKYLTKPNGYIYDSNSWTYGTSKTPVTFGSNVSDVSTATKLYTGSFEIYQNWQYASYQVTINKNKYTTGLSTFSYKAGEDFSVTNNNNIPTELNGYNISGWYITSATLANNDSDYNIYTSKGYINSSDESWMNNPKNYLVADYTYNTNLMYGNFIIEPIFDTTGLGPQNLIFDFGITNDEYNSGHSDEMVYTGMTFDEANVTYILEDIDINDSINLSEILNEVYLTIPKFYQNTTTNTKYYLVGWTGSSYSGEYKSSNLDKIYLYDGGVIPGNVVTDSVVYDDGGNLIGGKIYAVWAKLYEIRVALLEDATTGQETSLYNGSDLVQRGNDLKVEEPWQDSNANYYTFFYGETLENNPEVILYFDLNTAIGKIPNTKGYSLSYKHNENFASLEDVSLRTLSGYRIYGLINTTTYYVDSTGSSVTTSSSKANYTSYDVEDATKKVEFKSLISKLINYSTSKGTMGTIITIEPIWEEVKFNVVVNGDKNIDLDVIKNYSETFTVSATGAFDIWPKDANINVTTYDGWYFDYLTDASTDKNESEGKKWTQTISNGKTTNLPVGTDFYNKILKVNNGAVSNVYTISVEENSSDILNLTLKFNAHYIGAVYMLQIYHINAQGKTISNLEILEGENILDWVYDETSGKENVEDILVAGFNTNGGTTVNYSTTSLLSLLKKYSFSGSFTSKTYGIDNSEAFANYPYKLYRNGTNYFLTLQDKASFEEELLQEKANMQAGYYSLDFYDYASTSTTNTSTSYNHLCYDIGAMSIELNGTTKQFTEDSKYSDAFMVNYNNGNCDWQFNSNNISYSSAKKIYARWVRKIYDLNMSVKFEENDSNSGYLVAEVKDGTTTSYYAYVYITNETTGESSYKLYSIPNATIFKNYNFYGNWITNSNVKEIGTTLEVPAGSVVTISAYDQSEDINSDAMLGYRFNSVDILNPYTTTEFTCNVGDNTYITYSGCVEDANSKTCNYISTTTGTLSKYYIYSTGDKTIFDFTDSEMNKAFETHDRINLEANLEKIIYTLTGSIDSKYGSLSYEYSKGSQYGIYNFTLTDILVGDSLTVKYSSPLGYKLDGWNFVNSNGKSSNLATTSLIWTDGRVANSQLIDATFLRKYAYKDLTSYPTTANQVLGELTPKTSLIDFNINVTILNNVTKDRLEQFTITSTSQFVKLNDGTTVNLGGSYELIINPTNRTSYACYVNGSDYAVLKMYIADKNSKVASYIDYDFPVTSLDSLEFDLSTQFLDSLVQYTQGIPVVEDNRYINVLILVSEVITINSSDDTVLKETTDTYDIKYGIRQLSANGVVIASGENNKYITKQNTQYAYVGQKVKFEINALDSKYYSGAQITVNQNGLTSEYTLKSAGNCEVTLTENTTVTVKFIPATLDLVVNLMYRGVTYEASRYAELMNLSNIQILTKALDYSISDENGTLRTIKFFYGDIFTLVFNKNNFNSQFIVNDVLTEFEYRVLVNGQQIYEENDKYSSVLTKSTNVIIDIIDLTQNTVKVQTNMNNCGVIYGVSKSNIVKAIGDSQQEFMLYSGDTLTIYLDVATGYNFVNYSYNEEKSVVLIEETEGEYAGFYKFTLIEDYNSTLSGVYTLNFELITFDVELCYAVDGEVNNDAGSGYQLSSSTANINSEITVSNISTSKLANAGYKFIGYTIGQTYIDGQELYAGGSYYVTIDFADYAQYINTSNVLVIYINFIRQYQISVEVSGNDYEQTKVSLYESDVAKFENYSNTKLPWMSSYLDSSNYSKQVYKLVVDTKNETGMYFVSLSLNGNLIEISEENVLKKSVNNNVSALEYTFNLTSNEFTTYEFKITYMPEKLTTTLKEYYIDTIEQVNEYLNNSTLPTGSEYVVTDEDVVNRNNISSDKTNVKIYVRSSNTALANRYNVQHTININFDESYGYSIYQIWINNENVLDSNEKVNSSYYKWLITNSTEIKVIYKKICLVSQ